jgi:hypothetical protein
MDAVELQINFEWEPGEPVRAPELAATWARLEIWVGSQCVTQVEDIDSGSVRRSVYGSLYPLAEWIAYNWWLLRADSRPASFQPSLWTYSALRGSRTNLNRWLNHHNLRAVGEGFSWPDLTIIPEGRYSRVVWRADAADKTEARRPVRFIRTGEAWVETRVMEGSLAHLVDSVITRLSEQGVKGTALSKEWETLRHTDPEEIEFCLAAARLGLDPYAEALEVQDSILQASQELDDDVLQDFLSAVDPHRIDDGLRWVAATLREIRDLPAQHGSVTELRTAVSQRGELAVSAEGGPRPWDAGYRQARQVRQLLELEPHAPFEFADLMQVRDSDSHDKRLQAAGGYAQQQRSVLVLGRPLLGRQTRHFMQARALWHFLYDPLGSFLVTAAHTDRQKAERAFAAELLAPAEGIAELLDLEAGQFATDDLDAVAERFGVSSQLVRHQVDNQLLPH